ncbi:hypothetical protein AQUCO_04300017v1 [Aquilegia coerulea]|uniref:Uncharacterized protein n=1 Tax=Aquilegia coerulea TaxID=218851 RepID=A0A2G5CNN7_AQUCA|nr:hypothetical protein AQUCO_04300017v1 [Aquilegia coerulea]
MAIRIINDTHLTYPFDKITSIRICVKCFICLHGSCNLTCKFFSYSIINRYGSNLKATEPLKNSTLT